MVELKVKSRGGKGIGLIAARINDLKLTKRVGGGGGGGRVWGHGGGGSGEVCLEGKRQRECGKTWVQTKATDGKR